ncbi:MAG: fibronectin type III domain-containing protein [Verrucomicrobiota bacterium]
MLVFATGLAWILLRQTAIGWDGAAVQLGWDSEANPLVVGYRVYYGSASGQYTGMVETGNTNRVLVTGLTAGTNYYFAATAVTADGLESAPSTEIVYKPPGLLLTITRLAASGPAFSITSIGWLSNPWTLQTSPDLRTWINLATGTNHLVNLTLTNPAAVNAWFRLVTR